MSRAPDDVTRGGELELNSQTRTKKGRGAGADERGTNKKRVLATGLHSNLRCRVGLWPASLQSEEGLVRTCFVACGHQSPKLIGGEDEMMRGH